MEKTKKEKKEKNTKETSKPKKVSSVPSGYILFSKEERPKVLKETPDIQPKQILSEIASRWKSASEAVKKKFNDISASMKLKAKEENENMKNTENKKESKSKKTQEKPEKPLKGKKGKNKTEEE